MKTYTAFKALVLSLALTSFDYRAQAQSVVATATTTNSAGIVSEFGPGAIVIRSEGVAAPVRYTSTKTTTYVDEAGNPVSVETVKSGLPVTVYYSRVGDGLVADRVVVTKTTVVPPSSGTVIEKRTTTTTTVTNEPVRERKD